MSIGSKLRGARRRTPEQGPGGPPAPEPPAVERLPVWPSPEEAAASPFVFVRWPPGHYYSPLPDTRELGAAPRHSEVWPSRPRETPGIAWRDEAQVALCRDVFAAQERLAFRDEPSDDPTVYFTGNDQYSAFDAWVLEAFLRYLLPRRLIEIGSGFSTLVSARVNRELLDGSMHVTCIEPYPRGFLVDGVPGSPGSASRRCRRPRSRSSRSSARTTCSS